MDYKVTISLLNDELIYDGIHTSNSSISAMNEAINRCYNKKDEMDKDGFNISCKPVK